MLIALDENIERGMVYKGEIWILYSIQKNDYIISWIYKKWNDLV